MNTVREKESEMVERPVFHPVMTYAEYCDFLDRYRQWSQSNLQRKQRRQPAFA